MTTKSQREQARLRKQKSREALKENGIIEMTVTTHKRFKDRIKEYVKRINKNVSK